MSKTTAQTTTTTTTTTDNVELDEILETKDGKEYLEICELAGDTTKSKIYADKRSAANWIVKFNSWVASSKPKISMPKSTEVVKIPSNIIRINDRGIDYMYMEFQDGSVDGYDVKIKYATETHPTTGEEVAISSIASKTTVYTTEFSEQLAKNWIEKAKRLVPLDLSWKMYLKVGDRTHILSEKSFFKPYSELMDLLSKNKLLV